MRATKKTLNIRQLITYIVIIQKVHWKIKIHLIRVFLWSKLMIISVKQSLEWMLQQNTSKI